MYPFEDGVPWGAPNVLRLQTPRLTGFIIFHSVSSEDFSEILPKTYTSHARSHRSIETHRCISLNKLPVYGQL